jgi:hypothetical protein
MSLEWVLHPAMPYAVNAIGLALCLFLFASLTRDIRAGQTRSAKKLTALEAAWQAKMEGLDERWKELSQLSRLLVPPPPPRSGLNFNKRSQALERHRRGETPPEIAAALALPQNEVELLVKVQRIVLSSLDKPSSRAAGL